MVNGIIEKLKEKEVKNLSASQRLNFLADQLRKEMFNGDKEHDVLAMVAFYSYVNENYDKFYSEQYKKAFSITIGNFYTEDRIKKDFDKIIEEENVLETIINLENENVINSLIVVAHDKSKEDEKYESIYNSIKNKAISLGMGNETLLQIKQAEEKEKLDAKLDVDKEGELKSNAAKNLMDVINSQPVIPEGDMFKAPELDNSLKENFDKKVNESEQKINDIVKERGIDPNAIHINNAINLDDFSSNDRQERYNQIKETRKVAEQKADKIVNDAASSLNVDKKEVYKALTKAGVRPLSLQEGDIVISPEMVRNYAANEMIQDLPDTRYKKFINDLFSKISFKYSNVIVSDIDEQAKVSVDPGRKSQKFATAENNLLKVMRFSQSIKQRFVDTKNNAKEAIKNTIDIQKAKTKARNERIKTNIKNRNERIRTDIKDRDERIRTNISDSLHNFADKVAPNYNNSNIMNAENMTEVDYEVVNTNENSSILRLAESMKKNQVIGRSGNFASEISNPSLSEVAQKNM